MARRNLQLYHYTVNLNHSTSINRIALLGSKITVHVTYGSNTYSYTNILCFFVSAEEEAHERRVQGLILQGEKTSFPFIPHAIPSWTLILLTTPSLVSSCSLHPPGTSQSMPGIGSVCTPLRSVWRLTYRLLLVMRPMLIDKVAEMLHGQPTRKELQ
jgi:hypothetical protein